MLAERNTCQTNGRVHADAALQPGHMVIPLRKPTWYDPVKEVMDLFLALVLLAVTAPLVLLGAALVKLTSQGPAFYAQTRVGRKGRPYTLYKIRTMVHNCETLTGPCWATARDPRTTPVGRWLRRTHLDELPQLWNVLRGEMSLVGPRPERPEFIRQLERSIPHYRARLWIRPGLTGLSQIQLPADTDIESVRLKLAYDLYYVQQVGLWLDLRILLSTMFYLLGIPFAVPRRLFQVPSGAVVERAYQKLTAGAEAAPRLQPA